MRTQAIAYLNPGEVAILDYYGTDGHVTAKHATGEVSMLTIVVDYKAVPVTHGGHVTVHVKPADEGKVLVTLDSHSARQPGYVHSQVPVEYVEAEYVEEAEAKSYDEDCPLCDLCNEPLGLKSYRIPNGNTVCRDCAHDYAEDRYDAMREEEALR